MGHERHGRALLGPGGRGPLLHPDRGARASLHRPRLPRQPGAGGRGGRGRRARPPRPGTGRAPPPAQRRPALRTRDHLGPHAAAHRAGGRRVGREGDPPAEQGDRQPRVAPGGVHRPHPERDDRRRLRRACSASRTRRGGTPSTRRPRPSTTPTSSTTRAQGSSTKWSGMLVDEFRAYLGCSEVETRAVSGQMANTAVFSALVDYLNRADRKSEPRRIGKVVNNHIGKGGHLSAQPMGALRDYVARDPRTELPAVVDIPVLRGEPVQGGRRGAPRRDRAGAPRAHHPRQEHGAAPGAGVRGAPVPGRGWHPGRADVRHGPRARARRSALPAAVRRGRRHRHRLDPQDVLRHAARHRGRALGREPTRSTTCGRRSSGAPSPAR